MKTQQDKRLYWVWGAMLQRCENQKNKAYPNYGGRGITVCERWHKFINFAGDMDYPPDGYELDRIDNDKGYSPENCKWSTIQENLLNKGNYKNTNFGIKGVAPRSDMPGLFRVRVRRYKKIVLDQTVDCFFEACCIYKSFILKETKWHNLNNATNPQLYLRTTRKETRKHQIIQAMAWSTASWSD